MEAKLKVRFSSMKRNLTNYLNYTRACKDQLVELQERYDRAPDIWRQFQEVQEEIAVLLLDKKANAEEMEAHAQNVDKYEQIYYEAMAIARGKLNIGNDQQGDQIAQLQAQVQALGRRTPGPEDNTLKIKLPTLTIQPFHGEYDKWLTFKDAFTQAVHNKNIPGIQKFQLLQGLLKDSATKVIASLKASDANYTIAWDLLEKRFENKRLIINTHLTRLLDLSPAIKANPASLRNIIDEVRTHTRSLEALGQPTEHWDTMLTHVIANKLDGITREEWEKEISIKELDEIPTLEEILSFLEKRSLMLEMTERGKTKTEGSSSMTAKKKIVMTTTSTKCAHCEGSHAIYGCERFLKLSPYDRYTEIKIKRLKLCTNCLRGNHISKDCSSSSCRKCDLKHNTLLHRSQDQKVEGKKDADQSKGEKKVATIHCSQSQAAEEDDTSHNAEVNNTCQVATHCLPKQISQVILSTAQVYVSDIDGILHKCRALLDPGSQANMITEEFANKLKVPQKRIKMPINGVTQAKFTINKSVKIQMKSTTSNYKIELECLVPPVITEYIPQAKLKRSELAIPGHLDLADPEFGTPSAIDLLLGAGPFWKLLRPGEVISRKNSPTLQNTYLGWIIGGEYITKINSAKISTCNLVTVPKLEDQIEKFWKTEEVETVYSKTKEQESCEEHFLRTYKRDVLGRFQVELPKRPEVALGDSFDGALKRLRSLEKRFEKQLDVKLQYIQFMRDYESSGHMSIGKAELEDTTEVFYLPHQSIIKESSLTTKLRVVFDASSKTSLGTSLNDKLLPGPNLQNDNVKILLRFRMHEYVLTADIAQMFRQIEVAESDRNLQRILWREEVTQSIQIYTLNTVTYGTTCAPFLAMRCLKELAHQGRTVSPKAAEVLADDFYMDDLLTGTDTRSEATQLQEDLSELLMSAQFPLRKWRTNDQTILKHLTDSRKTENLLILDKPESIKTLGLLWNSNEDVLQYEIKIPDNFKVTKRKILPTVAQIYDPLGLIGPVVMTAKQIMQGLWQLNMEWDEEVPTGLKSTWETFCKAWNHLHPLKIPRNVNPGKQSNIALHGFCDASEKGFGACIYVLSINKDSRVQTRLLCSKSRVAPLKTLTLPRLELCAALLLAKVISVVKQALKTPIESIHLWSDSTITLCWIKSPPSQLQTFVANRVAEIQRLTSDATWHHVPSKHNPADILSRGINPEKLPSLDIWWKGPPWLISKECWPQQEFPLPATIPERKFTDSELSKGNWKQRGMIGLTAMPTTEDLCQIRGLLEKFSSMLKLQRVVAYCYRVYDIARKQSEREVGPITVKELERAQLRILRWTQKDAFPKEVSDLLARKMVENKSPLNNLKPYMDEAGIIRVGGRLSNAQIPYSQKHPVILPAKHHITTIIIREEHVRLKHCGPQLLLSSVRNTYWPLSGAREVRKVTRGCVPCFRYRPKAMEYPMADLPESRVNTLSRPFETTGVDYAGPIQVRESRRRGRVQLSKGYIAVFTCFATKAIHLELVSDLTTETFLAALRRFIARRGICTTIYSDNATNFVGAAGELEDLHNFVNEHNDELSTRLAAQKIEWRFIPARSPHFGGLWEAAVKSVKRHLYTVTKGLSYTFEEYYTLLTEIESILNSRPLMSLPSDPNEISVLTPSHFLIGTSPLEPASKCLLKTPDNHLSRWQHIQKLKQHFWKRWRDEYLHHLQSRTKWNKEAENLKMDAIVLIIDDNQPPLQWTLGRVIAVHQGKDDVARVVDVKTPQGVYRRNVRKLCALPLDS